MPACSRVQGAPGDPFRGHHRPRDQRPQRARRGAAKAVGSPPRRPRVGPRPAGRRHGRHPRWRERVAGARLQGQEADRLVTHIDPGVVSLVPELRGHERQPAEELEQWKTRVEERKVIDALTPAAITLGLLMTPAELEQLENIARNWRGRRSVSYTH